MSNSSKSEHQVCSQYDNPTANSDIGRVMITLTVFTGGFGIFGNIFIIVLAVKYTVRRSLHHLIISMAAADILVALATSGLWIIESLFEQKWSNIYQSVLCSSMSFFLLLGMWTTFVSLLIITVGRFRATRTTARRSKPSTQKQRILVLFFSWTTALLLASGEIVFKRDNLISDFSEPFQNGIGSVVHSLVFGTYCTIFVLNFLTLKRLSNNGAIENSIPEAQRQVRQKRMSSAIKMVLCSQFLYTCCYLPYDLEGIFRVFGVPFQDFTGKSKVFLFVVLPLVNSCFSPCIYLIFMPDFREAAKRLVFKRSRQNGGIRDEQHQQELKVLQFQENDVSPRRSNIASLR